MAISLPSDLQQIIQQNLLTRDIADALFPTQMFRRMVAERKEWGARLGETKIDTRRGLLPINTKPRTPGQDPTPLASANKEQWIVTARPYNDTIDTFLPTSHVSIVSLFMEDCIPFVMQAGQTLDHIVRNVLYNAYLSGNTYASAASTASTSLTVANINGFTTANQNSRPTPVSVANPLVVTVNGVANTVVGAVPTDPTNPNGPGVLTLGTAITASIGHAVLSVARARVVRAGAGTTSNAIAASGLLTLAMLRTAVKQLRQRNVPTHADGTYHLHMDPDSENQIFSDPEFQNLTQTRIDNDEIRNLALMKTMGVTFIRNNETPNTLNTSANDTIAADLTVPVGGNTGVNIIRPILTGAGAIVEEYINEGQFLADAGIEPLGRVSEMVSDGNGGYGAMMDGIRYLIRPPLDRLGNTVSQTWSFSGDWACPTDSLTYTPELFKRAVVLEHAASA